MRQDELHGAKPASDQLKLEGTDTKGDKLWKQTAAWLEKNPHAFEYMRAQALTRAFRGYPISMNALVNQTREVCRVSIPNAISPCLSRYMEAIDLRLRGKFAMKASCTDGYFPEAPKEGDDE